MLPAVTDVVVGSSTSLGNALTGNATLVDGQLTMNCEAREYTSSRVRGASKA